MVSSLLSKIRSATRKDGRVGGTIDMLKKLVIDKDIIQILQTRRLKYYGHVTRMGNDRLPQVLLHGYMHGRRPKGRPEKNWLTIFARTVQKWTPLRTRLVNSEQDRLGNHCSPHVMPARGGNFIVARAISQVNQFGDCSQPVSSFNEQLVT